jgi:hypothetical protein
MLFLIEESVTAEGGGGKCVLSAKGDDVLFLTYSRSLWLFVICVALLNKVHITDGLNTLGSVMPAFFLI